MLHLGYSKLLTALLFVVLAHCRNLPGDEGGRLTDADCAHLFNGHDTGYISPFDDTAEMFGGGSFGDTTPSKQWPIEDGHITVPYTIPSNLPSWKKQDLCCAINEFHEKTSVRCVLAIAKMHMFIAAV